MSNDPSALADFENDAFDQDAIRKWAQEQAGLPAVSADPFCWWLNGVWNDYDDSSGTQTNEDVLNGALAHWKGEA